MPEKPLHEKKICELDFWNLLPDTDDYARGVRERLEDVKTELKQWAIAIVRKINGETAGTALESGEKGDVITIYPFNANEGANLISNIAIRNFLIVRFGITKKELKQYA